MNPIQDHKIFMEACGQITTHRVKDHDQIELYTTLVDEEYAELVEAQLDNDRENIAKEIIDCIVVLIGLGYSYGFDMQAAWNAVHESNMSKVDPLSGTVLRRADGKILKPSTYKAPDMSKAV